MLCRTLPFRFYYVLFAPLRHISNTLYGQAAVGETIVYKAHSTRRVDYFKPGILFVVSHCEFAGAYSSMASPCTNAFLILPVTFTALRGNAWRGNDGSRDGWLQHGGGDRQSPRVIAITVGSRSSPPECIGRIQWT